MRTLVPLLLALAACAAPSARPGSPPAGGVQLGALTGEFHATHDPRRPADIFEVSLYATSPSGKRDHVLGIARYGGGRPRPGRYPLVITSRGANDGRIYAVYTRTRGDTTASYVSRSGELTITESTDRRVAGRFSFTGAEYSAHRGGERSGSGSPFQVPPGAPTVRVHGTFSATPLRPQRATWGG